MACIKNISYRMDADVFHRQGFKIIYCLMGPCDPQAMILMGPRALEMGPIIDVFNWKFRYASPGLR